MWSLKAAAARLALLGLVLSASTPTLCKPIQSTEHAFRALERRQTSGLVAASDFLRRAYHGAAIAGSWLYIDGGEYSFLSSGIVTYAYASSTLSIDLSKGWDASTVAFQSTSKPQDVPDLVGASLWYHAQEQVFYSGFTGRASLFGGDSPVTPISLWSFTPDGHGGGSWSEVIRSNDAALVGYSRPFEGAMAFGPSSAYVLGGTSINGTEAEFGIPLPGLVEYDMSAKKFTNSTASGYGINGTSERGAMHYVPSFGDEGIFVVMGGDTSPLDTYTPGSQLQSFSNILIYDPASKQWYNQTASGTIPDPRIEFCVTGANSTNGTYEILMYGGWGSNLGTAAIPYDSVYILSLPGFYWIKASSYSPEFPRHGHTCHAVGGSQILVVGGVDSSSVVSSNLDEGTFATKDNFAQGLAVWDMTLLSFGSQYTPTQASTYQQSTPIENFYASNARAPPEGWVSPQLSSLFAKTKFPTPTGSALSNGSSSPSSSPSSTPSSSHAGAIAGGTVGGIAVVALLAGLVFFLMRRRRTRASSTQAAQHSNSHGPAYATQGGIHEVDAYTPPTELNAESEHAQFAATGNERKSRLFEKFKHSKPQQESVERVELP